MTRYASAILAATALGLLGLGTPSHASEDRPPAHEVAQEWASPARAGNPAWVERDYERLLELFEKHPDQWGGAFIDGDLLVVATVLNPDDARRSLSALDLRGRIEVKSVDRSMADLDELMHAAAARLGDAVVQIGPQYATNRVMIGVSRWSADLDKSLADLPVDAIGLYRIDDASSASRYYDTPPMYGGAALIFRSTIFTQKCSSGFGWSNANGYPIRLLSAGHCARTGALAWPDVERPTSSTTSVPLGSVVWSSVDAGGTISGLRGDLAGIKLDQGIQSAARIWVGAYDTTQSRAIIGRRTLPENWTFSNVYTSGAAGFAQTGPGERQLTQVLGVNQSLHYSDTGQTMRNLTTMIGAGCVSDGDSGGAVYQVTTTGDAWAIGVISGVAYGSWGCTSAYTPVGFAAADWGGDVLN